MREKYTVEPVLADLGEHARRCGVVNDLRTGPAAKGAVALWLDVGTEAHFRNLTVRHW